MYSITRLSAEEFAAHVEDLSGLLTAVVADGASLGFVSPFDQDAARQWWNTQLAEVSAGRLIVWVAHTADAKRISGTISLALERKPNGRHRADVVKLMVHRDARGKGLARALLATAESAAAQAGARLLLLDTVTGSPADQLYQSAGWTRYGIVPSYATDPSGSFEDASFFYKQLA